MTKYILGGSILGVMVFVLGGVWETHSTGKLYQAGSNPAQAHTAAFIKGSSLLKRAQEEGSSPITGIGGEVALFNAMREVESGGERMAVGDCGRSRGPYQCGRAAWTDSGINLDYDTHVWHRRCAERVMLAYWERYDCLTDEARSRVWNGGPRGLHKQATLLYWAKVKRILDRGKV